MKQSLKVIETISHDLEREADIENALLKYNADRISKDNIQVAQSIKKRNDSLLSELLKH